MTFLKPFPTLRIWNCIQVQAIVTLLVLAGCGPFETDNQSQPIITGRPTTGRTPPSVVVSTRTPAGVPQSTALPTPIPTTLAESPVANTIACPGITCVWQLDQDPPEYLPLESTVETVYDYSPSTQRILHGKFTGRGAGPGNVAVTDLQFSDLNGEVSRKLIPEESVVEAVWAPDGKNLAYVKATSDTYELHWLTESGEDRLLARDVAFTFSVSPAGDQIAFTRESNYQIPSLPGLYIVDISSGEEWAVSPVDREGTGSIIDRPIWSFDGSQIILPVMGRASPPGLVRAAADGNSSNYLAFSPAVQEAIGGGALGANLLWHPDNMHLIGQVYPDMLGSEPNRIFSFELDPALEQLSSADLILEGEGELIGWAEPGISVWVARQLSNLTQLPLP